MKTSTITEAPAIYTADGNAISVGDRLYGVDTDCTKDRVPHVEALVVTQIDLGSRRQVRLRRPRGTEWIWQAQDHRGSCRTEEQLLYKSKATAKQIAMRAALDHVKEIQSESSGEIGSLEQAKKDYQYEVNRIKNETKKAASKIAAYRKKIKATLSA